MTSPAKSSLAGWILLVIACALVLPTEADTVCPPITPGEGSPLFPQRTKGGNVTMYRVFHTVGNPPLVNITWAREPSSLSSSKGRYLINNTLSRGTVRASIKLWDLRLFPDLGSYTVTVCSNCTCNKTTFVLKLFQCDPSVIPQPVMQYIDENVTESFSQTLLLYSIFNGSTNTFFYTTVWTHEGKDLCYEGTAEQSALFTCNRTFLDNCTFSANLFINGFTIKNSGNYTVQAVGGGSASRNSTIHVNISREPRIKSCTPGPLTRDYSGNSLFQCQILSYSDYVQVVVVEDNEREYNESTRDLSFGCEAQTREGSSLATCTVSISSSAHSGKREYRLCAGYNNSVAHNRKRHCSDCITIVPGNSNRVLLGMVVEGTVLVVLLALILLLCMGMTSRAEGKSRFETNDDPNPLFKQGGALHSSCSDSVRWEALQCHKEQLSAYLPGSSPKLSGTHTCYLKLTGAPVLRPNYPTEQYLQKSLETHTRQAPVQEVQTFILTQNPIKHFK